MMHELKISYDYYDDVVDGLKTFEIRLNDRDFKVGDLIFLNELADDTTAEKPKFSGRQALVEIKYILSDFIGLADGYVAMSIHLLWNRN
jgi:ParB family transcriptional regulator, chromosome partitioning protein